MKQFWLGLIVLSILVTGCDSNSESYEDVQLFPASPVGGTKTLNVPDEYATIQIAVNAANSGDIIRVAARTYEENVSIDSKRFSLRGAGKGLTTIRGTVYIEDSSDVSLEGFTITSGGVHARRSSVIISANEIIKNPGPGLWIDECTHALVSDNAISDNGGEGMLIDASAGVFGSNVVERNGTDGVVVNNSSVQLVGNVIRSNTRDGVAVRGITYAASPNLLQNTIQRNGGVSNYDIICFGGNANPTGSANTFDRCINCAECRSFGRPPTYDE